MSETQTEPAAETPVKTEYDQAWSQVKVIDLNLHQDERGQLYEVIHGSDEFLDKFGQVYVVQDPRRDTIRAYHRHKELWDYFCIVNGSAKFILAHGSLSQDANESDEGQLKQKLKVITLTARKPQLLIVPATVWHGWMSLEDNTILLSTANREYNAKSPDEERINPKSFRYDLWPLLEK